MSMYSFQRGALNFARLSSPLMNVLWFLEKTGVDEEGREKGTGGRSMRTQIYLCYNTRRFLRTLCLVHVKNLLTRLVYTPYVIKHLYYKFVPWTVVVYTVPHNPRDTFVDHYSYEILTLFDNFVDFDDVFVGFRSFFGTFFWRNAHVVALPKLRLIFAEYCEHEISCTLFKPPPRN